MMEEQAQRGSVWLTLDQLLQDEPELLPITWPSFPGSRPGPFAGRFWALVGPWHWHNDMPVQCTDTV
jgi:hypothetical protein